MSGPRPRRPSSPGTGKKASPGAGKSAMASASLSLSTPSTPTASVGASTQAKLLFSITGIYACYLYYGVLQQALYTKQEDGTKLRGTAFVLMVQCVFNAAIAGAWMLISAAGCGGGGSGGEETRAARPPFARTLASRDVMLVSAVYVGAMFASNESLRYVDYAYQALAKSCKLIPVMVGRIVINKETYGPVKYACVLLMTAGITAYEFLKDGPGGAHGGAHGSGASTTSYMGLALLAFSLALDGASGPGQETIKHLLSQAEQMLASNVWGAAYMLAITVGLGQLGESVAYLGAHPQLLSKLVQFSLCSAFGQLFIFYTMREFDSLVLSTITTTRKFATIVVNVLVFSSKLNHMQWGCVLVVFGAVAFDAYTEATEKRKKHAKKLECH